LLGAIVLDQIRTATTEVPARLVIDGQQRLTTLQLLMVQCAMPARLNLTTGSAVAWIA
jgi:uncharacterized protein with ParB-like and HNH nuclease domain